MSNWKDTEHNIDFSTAKSFEKLKIGNLGVYFREGLKMRCIPYSDMDSVFIRIHEVNGKLCCGSTVFQYFRMVFVKDGKEFADYICENEKAMDDALKEIGIRAPALRIGFSGED